eukprot:2655888-Rhodomonas_salina.1
MRLRFSEPTRLGFPEVVSDAGEAVPRTEPDLVLVCFTVPRRELTEQDELALRGCSRLKA